MRRSRVQGLTNLGSISEIVCYVASTVVIMQSFLLLSQIKVDNSAIFWTITALLLAKLMQQRSFREFNLVPRVFNLPTPKGARKIFFSLALWGGEMKEPGNEVVENLNLKMRATNRQTTYLIKRT